jgi:DNA-damage-inducible protein D
MSLPEIKQRKRIGTNEKLFDRAGLTELAANAFRATQTKDALKRRGIKGERVASDTHFKIGNKVRSTIKAIGGTLPEDLPAEPPIKTIAPSKRPKQISN